MNNRGVAPLVIVLWIAGGGLGLWGLSKTKYFNGDTKRAATSTATTAALISATDNQGASAAAYVATIGEANAGAPDSKEKQAIAGLVPVALSYLPAPDPKKLLEAEKLKNAYLTGQLTLANSLTAGALSDAATARQETVRAIAAKRASDTELTIEAAKRLGAEQQAFWLWLAFGAASALTIYVKITHLSPGSLANIVADIRNGTGEANHALAAIDSATSPTQQLATKGNVWFKSKLAKLMS